MIRENLVDRAHRELAVREIQELAGDYVELLARTHPYRTASEWLAYVGQQIHAVRDLQDATELLSDILEALDQDGQR